MKLRAKKYIQIRLWQACLGTFFFISVPEISIADSVVRIDSKAQNDMTSPLVGKAEAKVKEKQTNTTKIAKQTKGKKPEQKNKRSYNVDKKNLKEKLTPLQFKVTQKDGTEPAFNNTYWDNKKQGIYVDIVSGEPLFSSTHKYDSKTGWPSFYETIEKDHIVKKEDYKLFRKRTEVRSKHGDSHLGHVFDDGPNPTGLRYCINSAALKFIPVEDLEKEGYGEYLSLFKDEKGGLDLSKSEAKAYFAAGCFWCIESDFDKINGVLSTTSGYSGGSEQDAEYKKVSAGTTAHVEALEVTYDPKQVSYEELLQVFWVNVDPFAENKQFCDSGPQYRSVVYFQNEAEKKAATESIAQLPLKVNPGDVKTEVTAFKSFYPAEDYHQDYYRKNPVRYKFYRTSCGRDSRLKSVWGEHRTQIMGKFAVKNN